jgi:hypothetical protein
MVKWTASTASNEFGPFSAANRHKLDGTIEKLAFTVAGIGRGVLFDFRVSQHNHLTFPSLTCYSAYKNRMIDSSGFAM